MKKHLLFGSGFALVLGLLTQIPAQTVDNVIPPDGDNGDGTQVLAYGQMHEAFAQPAESHSGAGPAVAKQPPDPVPEMPPEEKPEGDNVQWFAGYWSWDLEKQDFIWISGVYRAVPAGQQFVPGYWNHDDQGWHWVAGFWSAAQNQEVTYTPEPPKNLDQGPNLPPPNPQAVYSPGYWYYANTGYYWHPGIWVVAKPGLVWIPPHYHWTPAGWILVGGYWDYPLEERGLVFAPVYFGRPYWVGDPGWHYYPRSVISVTFVTDSFFVGPHHSHYYFGAYYGPQYHAAGFTAWVAFGPKRHDPLFSYYKYEHRNDPGWHNHMVTVYNERVTGKQALPPKIVNNTFVTYNVTNTTIINKTTVNKVNAKGPIQVMGVAGAKAPKVPTLAKISPEQVQKQVAMNQAMHAAVKSRQELETQFAKKPGSPASTKPVSLSVNQFQLPSSPVTKVTPKIDTPHLPGINALPKGKDHKPPTTGSNPGPKTTLPDPKVSDPKVTTPPPPKGTQNPPPPKGTPPMPPKGTTNPPKGGSSTTDHKNHNPPKSANASASLKQAVGFPPATALVLAEVTSLRHLKPAASSPTAPVNTRLARQVSGHPKNLGDPVRNEK